VFVDGDSLESYLVAVVVPDADVVARTPFVHWETDAEQRRGLEKLVMADMDVVARADGLHGFERVKKIFLTTEAFTVENDLVTPTLKPKRAKLATHFKDVIRALYATGPKQ